MTLRYLFVFLLVVGPLAQGAELTDRIDAYIKEVMERDQIPGVSVGVAKGGEVLVAKGYGYAEMENDVEATEHTVYRIGSVSKQFTSVAIMMLVEQGKLRLDDEMTKFFPDYPTHGLTVTVDRLLNHTSGIKGYTEMESFWSEARLDLSHEEMIELFSSVPFEFEPGEKYQYNNSAYYLLGLIIEKVSGREYAEFLEDNVFEPLGLRETHYLYNAPIVKNRAEGYEVDEGAIVNDEPLSMRLPYAAGSLGSSVMDLLAWQKALEDHKLLSKESYEKMRIPAQLIDGSNTTYGYGLALGRLEGRMKIAHGGGINGFRAQLSHYPDDDLTVVVLCNSGSAHPDAYESRIARAALDIPEKVVKPIELSEEALAMYVGVYDSGRSPLEVRIEDGMLTMAGYRLRPVGDHVFLPTVDDYSEIIFTVESGKAVSVRMEREGHVVKAPRSN
jgi:CubicO group peptidase (beta-lactamase class C family)